MNYRKRRWLWTLVIIVAIYAVVGFFVLPPVVKHQLEKRLTAESGRTVSVGRVRLNPFALSATIEQFDVRSADGNSSFAGWDRLYVNFEALASIQGDWVVGDVELSGFHAAVDVASDGSLNFSDVLDKLNRAAPANRGPSTPARPVRVGRLRVSEAQVDFTDRSRRTAFHTVIGPMDFSLIEFRSVGATGAPYHFEAATEAGESFAWSGTLSAAPLASQGSFRIEHVMLSKYGPYIESFFAGKIASGQVDVSGKYDVQLSSEARRLSYTDGAVQLRNFQLTAAGKPVLDLPKLDVTGINADGTLPKLAIDSVRIDGGHVAAERTPDGAIDLLALLKTTPETPAPALPKANGSKSSFVPTGPLDLLVKQIEIHGFSADVRDRAAARPAELGLTGIEALIKNVSLADGASIPIDVTLGWQPEGTVHVGGAVSLSPVRADLQLDVRSLALAPVGPYLETFANATITQGSASLKGNATAEISPRQSPKFGFSGEAHVEKLALVDTAHTEALAGVSQVSATGIKLSMAPSLSVAVGEVKLDSPYANVIMSEDQKLNLTTLMKSAAPAVGGEAGKPTLAVPATPPPPPEIAVDRIVIEGGTFSFTDRSVRPAVAMSVGKFSGSIRDWSSAHPDQGQAELHATIGETGPLAVAGQVNPLGGKPLANLKVDFKSIDLKPAGPYVSKYAGYELDRGRLNLDTQAKINGDQLDIQNAITVEQLTLGRATPGPDATKLPVRLGIALLKDSSGKIVLNVPVQGSLSDPNFQIGPVVSHVFVNLLTKAATSPFTLLGSMFGGGGEELGEQTFAAGSSEIAPDNEKKIETVARALANRPALNVGLEPGFDANADRSVLQQRKLDATVRQHIRDERHPASASAQPTEQAEISEADYAAMVQRLFRERFPGSMDANATAAPQPASEVAPEPKKPKSEHRSLAKKTWDFVTLKKLRERHADRKEEAKAAAAAAETSSTPTSGPSLDEMKRKLAETMEITPGELRELASGRARSVRERLISVGKISPDRVSVQESEQADPGQIGARVLLHLQ